MVEAQFIIDFRGIHFNAKEDLSINFQKYASIFCRAMISTINGGENGQLYVLPKSVCATTNIDFPIKDRYSGLICQYSLANILNVSERFIKLLH